MHPKISNLWGLRYLTRLNLANGSCIVRLVGENWSHGSWFMELGSRLGEVWVYREVIVRRWMNGLCSVPFTKANLVSLHHFLLLNDNTIADGGSTVPINCSFNTANVVAHRIIKHIILKMNEQSYQKLNACTGGNITQHSWQKLPSLPFVSSHLVHL